MRIRSLVLFSFAAATLCLASSAGATGTGGSSSTTTAGAGGASYVADCSVDLEQVEGTTCAACDPTTTACSMLSSDYNLVCQSSATAAVYCNGPIRDSYSDQNVACSVAQGTGGASSAFAAGALVAAAALMMRRRRRA